VTDRYGAGRGDLEEVGRDHYHHTFFEMLGNWSFGDYYKKEAIRWAWELLTEVWKLPRDRLFATVHATDEEAIACWQSETDIARNRILPFGDKSNFWEMGRPVRADHAPKFTSIWAMPPRATPPSRTRLRG